MTYEELERIIQWRQINPWEHDYYYAHFSGDKSLQEVLDYLITKIPLDGWQTYVKNNLAYFAVPKSQKLPDDLFSAPDFIEPITDVPGEPAPTVEPTPEP